MTDKEIFDGITKIVLWTVRGPVKPIRIDSNLVQEFSIDSLDEAEILVGIAMEFNIKLSKTEEDLTLQKFKKSPTMQTLINIVKENNITR